MEHLYVETTREGMVAIVLLEKGTFARSHPLREDANLSKTIKMATATRNF